MTIPFEIDPRLVADTLPLAQWPLCDLRLMDDARYPWLILVPRVVDARELIDLDELSSLQLRLEIDAASRALRDAFAPDKLNVAALGNVVEQLHVHVIARFHGDDAWPAPVWGRHPRIPRDDAALESVIERLLPTLPSFAFTLQGYRE